MVTTPFQGSRLQVALEKGDPRVKESRETFERTFGRGGAATDLPPKQAPTVDIPSRPTLAPEQLESKISREQKILTPESFALRQRLREFAGERGLDIETPRGLQETLLRGRAERRAFARGEVEATGEERVTIGLLEDVEQRSLAGDIEATQLLGRISGGEVFTFKETEKEIIKEPTFKERIIERLEETIGGRTLLLTFRGPPGFDIATGQIVPEREFERRQEARKVFAGRIERLVDIEGIVTPFGPLRKQTTDLGKDIQSVQKAIIKETLTTPILKPGKVQLLLATGTILPSTISGVGRLSSAIIGTRATRFLGVAGGLTLGGLFARQVAAETGLAKGIEAKARVITGAGLEIGLLGGVRAKPLFVLKKPFPKFDERLFLKDLIQRQQATLLEKGFFFDEARPPFRTLAKKFAGDEVIVFKGEEVLGKQLQLVKQARATRPPKPVTFEIEPTLAQQRQLTRLEKGLDVLESIAVKEGVRFKIRESPKPEGLKTLELKPVTFKFEIEPTFKRQDLLRLEKGLDILEVGEKGFKIREAPKPESIRVLEELAKPKLIPFDIKPIISRQELLRLEKGLDVLDISKQGVVVREAPKPEVLKALEIRTIKPLTFDVKPDITKQELLRLERGLDVLDISKEGFKIREAPKPEVLRTKRLVEIDLVKQAQATLPIEKEITRRIAKPKPFVIKEIKLEPFVETRVGRQQLVQVLKEPKIKLKRISDITLEDIRVAKLFPGFVIPTTRFGAPKGRIPAFERLGKITGLDVFEGRIPSDVLQPKVKFRTPKQLQAEAQIKSTNKILTKSIQSQAQRDRLIFGVGLRERQRLRQPQAVSQLVRQAQRQRFRQPQIQLQAFVSGARELEKERQRQRERTFIRQRLEFEVPRTTIGGLGFPLGEGRRKRKGRKDPFSKSATAFVESFISRQTKASLERGVEIREIKNIGKEARKIEQGFGLTTRLGAPVIR